MLKGRGIGVPALELGHWDRDMGTGHAWAELQELQSWQTCCAKGLCCTWPGAELLSFLLSDTQCSGSGF